MEKQKLNIGDKVKVTTYFGIVTYKIVRVTKTKAVGMIRFTDGSACTSDFKRDLKNGVKPFRSLRKFDLTTRELLTKKNE